MKTLKIHLVIIIGLFVCVSILEAQSLDRKVFSSGGGTNTIGIQNYNYTFGEPIVGSDFTIPNLTKGFQQPEPILILPIRINLLEPIQEVDQISLAWITNQEFEGDQFFIERSNDGILFESLHEKLGTYQKSYSWEDISIEMVSTAILYYRITQFSIDGSFVSSQIQQVRLKRASTNLYMYPNPVDTQIFLKGEATEAGHQKIMLIDMQGRKIWQKNIAVAKGSFLHAIPVQSFSEGMYLVRTMGAGGELQERIQVQH